MKKYCLILSVIFLASFFIVSCSSSIDRDAKKAAEYFCQLYELIEEGNWEAVEVRQADIEAFDKELENKYDFDDEEFYKEWQDAIGKALERLDCGITIDDLQ